MSPFEYVTIPVSIILAFGLGRILTAVIEISEKGKRDWVHLFWCALMVVVMLGQWLAVWRLQPNVTWEGYEFYILMVSPLLFFTAAHMLVPSNYQSVQSWGDHLLKVSRPLLVVMMLSLLNFWLRNFVAIGEAPNLDQFIWPTAMLATHGFALWRPTKLLMVICGLIWVFAVVLTVLQGSIA